jgi:hypothetical protein
MSNQEHAGTCICGTVRFKTHGELRGVVYCHCTQCRRQSTHFYAMTNVMDAALEVSGADNVQWYEASADAKRGFCKTCGSALFWKHKDLNYTSVSAGAFESPTGLTSQSHIFVADKGDYYDISDGLPQFARSTPSLKVAGD